MALYGYTYAYLHEIMKYFYDLLQNLNKKGAWLIKII